MPLFGSKAKGLTNHPHPLKLTPTLTGSTSMPEPPPQIAIKRRLFPNSPLISNFPSIELENRFVDFSCLPPWFYGPKSFLHPDQIAL